jgi:hypothetical protein
MVQQSKIVSVGILILAIIGIQACITTSLSLLSKEKKAIKREVKARILSGIPEGELTQVSFDVREPLPFEWVKDDEIWYQSAMYDIVRMDQCGHIQTFYCFEDIKESEVKQKIRRIATQIWEQDTDRSTSRKILDWSKSLVYLPEVGASFYYNAEVENTEKENGYVISSPLQYLYDLKVDRPPQSI